VGYTIVSSKAKAKSGGVRAKVMPSVVRRWQSRVVYRVGMVRQCSVRLGMGMVQQCVVGVGHGGVESGVGTVERSDAEALQGYV
jgi:hypothetical protein